MVRTINNKNRQYYVAEDVCKTIGIPWNGRTLSDFKDGREKAFMPVVNSKGTRVERRVVTKTGLRKLCKQKNVPVSLVDGNTTTPKDLIKDLPEAAQKKIVAIKTINFFQAPVKSILTLSQKKVSIKGSKPLSPRQEIVARCKSYANMLHSLNGKTSNASACYDLTYNLLYAWFKRIHPSAPDLKALAKKSKTSDSILEYAETHNMIDSLLITAKIIFNSTNPTSL